MNVSVKAYYEVNGCATIVGESPTHQGIPYEARALDGARDTDNPTVTVTTIIVERDTVEIRHSDGHLVTLTRARGDGYLDQVE